MTENEEESARGASLLKLMRFDPEVMRLDTWTQIYDTYVEMAGVPQDKRRHLLITSMTSKAVETLASLCRPKKMVDHTVNALFEKLKLAYVKKVNTRAETVKFLLVKQQPGQSLVQFAGDLRNQTVKCDFPDSMLDEMLCSEFTAGLLHEETRAHLQTLPKSAIEKFDACFEYAVQFEAGQAAAKQPYAAPDYVAFVNQNYRGRSSGRGRSRGRGRGGFRGRSRGGYSNNRGGSRAPGGLTCFCCGSTQHIKPNCPLKDEVCRGCGRTGHIVSQCRSSRGGRSGRGYRATNYVSEYPQDVLQILHTGPVTSSSIFVAVNVNGAKISIEFDTGSAATILSREMWYRIGSPELKRVTTIYRSFTGEPVRFLGRANVVVKHRRVKKTLQVLVSESDCCVMGRDWIAALDLTKLSLRDLQESAVYQVNSLSLEQVLNAHQRVFREELGCSTMSPVHLHLKENARPAYCRPRPVPFGVREEVEQELNNLEKQGIISKVDFSDWAAPIVVVKKEGRKIRVCADFSTGLNASLDMHQYPLPHPDELFAKLNGGQQFSKLDMKEAYAQLPLDEESSKLLVINTHKGLYQFKRLAYGVNSGAAVFQANMDKTLEGCEGALAYMDDIVVTGRTPEEHLRNLKKVFERLEAAGFTVRREKCSFMQDSIEFLGFIVDKTGRQVSQEKIRSVIEMPPPEDVSQLRSFLGMVNHYGKFLPNLSRHCAVFHDLLKKDVSWIWSEECQSEFEMVKKSLAEATLLVHFDPGVPLVVAADASQYGIGAVLSHRYSEEDEKPIVHVSKTLSKAERNYSQIEKEALALVFGVKKFHQYLYGREFTLLTDHKPLVSVFGSKKGVPVVAANRLQRWAIVLSGYTFIIEYRRTEDFGQADGLSRLPRKSADLFSLEDIGFNVMINIIHQDVLSELPVDCDTIARESADDSELRLIFGFVREGWPNKVAEVLTQINERPSNHTENLWNQIKKYLHATHAGIVRMKAEARSHCWWPNIDKDLENLAAECAICSMVSKDPAKAELRQWPVPPGPWHRIHIDFAGPYKNEMLLLVVDAFSKWPEVFVMKNISAAETLRVIDSLFTRYGLCVEIVSDNGTQFTAEEFGRFCAERGIKHTLTPPYHPQSNGQAERYVETVKVAIGKGMQDGKTLAEALKDFLARYRTTPHSTTGKTPSELFLNRKMRTLLDLIKPTTVAAVSARENQKLNFDKHTKDRPFLKNQLVLAKDFRAHRKHPWASGKLVEPIGAVMCSVYVDGSVWRRHVNQLLPRKWLTEAERKQAERDAGTVEWSVPAKPLVTSGQATTSMACPVVDPTPAERAAGGSENGQRENVVPGNETVRGFTAAQQTKSSSEGVTASSAEARRLPSITVEDKAEKERKNVENQKKSIDIEKKRADFQKKATGKSKTAAAATAPQQPAEVRRSGRMRKEPDYFGEYVKH